MTTAARKREAKRLSRLLDLDVGAIEDSLGRLIEKG